MMANLSGDRSLCVLAVGLIDQIAIEGLAVYRTRLIVTVTVARALRPIRYRPLAGCLARFLSPSHPRQSQMLTERRVDELTPAWRPLDLWLIDTRAVQLFTSHADATLYRALDDIMGDDRVI